MIALVPGLEGGDIVFLDKMAYLSQSWFRCPEAVYQLCLEGG